MRPPLSDRALLTLLAAVTALGPITTNLYLPALPFVREYFGATVAGVQSTFSVALVTLSFGLLTWGPIADRYGRRFAILAGLGVHVVGAFVCLVAPTLGWLVLGRAIQAFGTATGIVVARAIVVDLYSVDRMVRVLANLTMVGVLANSLAPLLGGFFAHGLGWRAIFGVLVFAATIIALAVWQRLPETRPATTRPPRAREMATVAWSLLRMPMFAGCVLQSGAIYATFFVLLSLTPYVMVAALGRPPTEFGLYYLFIAAGYFLGNWSVKRLTTHHDLHWMVLAGVGLTVAGAVAALAAFALGLEHPLWLFVPMAVLAYGQGLALPNLTATAVSLAPQHAGVASSTIGFLQQIVGAAAAQWMGQFRTDTAMPMLTFCVAVCVLALGMLYVFPRVQAGRRHR